MSTLITELKRRNVFRVAMAYVVISWLVLQVANTLAPILNLPANVSKIVLLILIVGFIPAVFFSWAFEITPEGIKKEQDVVRDESVTNVTAKKLDIITLLAALGVFALVAWQHFNPATQSTSSNSLVFPAYDYKDVGGSVSQGAITEAGIQSQNKAMDHLLREEDVGESKEISNKSIAVLPFVNMSGDTDNEYFSDGITEEIINALSKIEPLRVVSRTSSFTFKGRNLDLIDVAKKLNVEHLLEGSVRKQADTVRITAQLIKAENGFHLWSETYDAALVDIFDVQDKISRAIADELQILLDLADDQRLAKSLTNNQQAYDLFLQGRELGMHMYGQKTLPKAVELLEKAVELDPEFAEAWSWLAMANYMLPQMVTVPDEKPYIDAGVAAAIQSNKLDPELSGGYSILGSKNFQQKNYLAGFELIDRAYAIEPNEPMNIFNMGFYRSMIGQTKTALPYLKNAVELDPVGGGWINNYALTLLADGNTAEAEKQARRSMDTGYVVAAFTVADVLKQTGNEQGALDILNAHYDDIKAFSIHFQSREVWDMALQALYTSNIAAKKGVGTYLQDYFKDPKNRPDVSSVGGFHLVSEPELFMQAIEKYNFAGASYLLTRIWDQREGSVKLRQHPDFPAFLDRLGLVEVWQTMGWPDICRPDPGTDGSDLQFECD